MQAPYRRLRCSAEDDPGICPALALRHLILALEALDPTSGIDNLLLTSKKWVASIADFNLDRFLGSPGSEVVSTSTTDAALYVFWMDFGLHDSLRMHVAK